jgi:transcription elongation GreA/GreB family factor
VDDPARDLNADSPVGQALLVAGVGDEKQVEVPGGYVVVKVLGIRYEDA